MDASSSRPTKRQNLLEKNLLENPSYLDLNTQEFLARYDTREQQYDDDDDETMPPESQTPDDPVNVSPGEETQVSQPTTTNNKKTSWVWSHMDIREVNGQLRAFCQICKVKDFTCASTGGTGHIARHLKVCLPKHGHKESGQTQIQSTGSVSDWGNFRYTDEQHRKGLVEYIIRSEQSFATVDNPNFRNYVHTYLNPSAKFPSRNTLKSDSMKRFEIEQSKLISYLKTIKGTISLTCDSWKSQFGMHYICVTAHYVDLNWILQKRIISMAPYEYPHSGPSISSAIQKTTRDWGIKSKIFSISFDNATNNTSSLESLIPHFQPILEGQLFHIRCICHIINLIVQDGLAVIQPHIENVKNVINFIKTHGYKKQEFKHLCRQYGLKYKTFLGDAPHRWNTTYLLCKLAYEFKEPLTEFCSTSIPGVNLTQDNWNICYLVMKYLEKFYELTNLFSGVYYPTSHLVLTKIYEICEVFAAHRDIDGFKEIVAQMEIKFNKYWEAIPPIFSLAAVFDPRIKLTGLGTLLELCKTFMEQDPLGHEFEDIRKLLNKMFDIYQLKYGNQSQTSTQHSTKGKDSLYWKLSQRSRTTSSTTTTSINELQTYLQTDFTRILDENEMNDLDVLAWWKKQEQYYPVLAAMARDLLTVPMSTIASEMAFSAGKRVLDEKRSRLRPESLEMSICLKDWLDADDRTRTIIDEYSGSSEE